MKRLMKTREFTLTIIMALLCVVVSFISPAFLQMSNLTNILNSSIPTIVLGCGMTMVIITGGIEVAVAAEMIVTAYVTGLVAQSVQGNLLLCIMAALSVGLTMGVINGLLIAYLNVPPFIATIGSMNMFRGALLLVTESKWLMNLPEYLTGIARNKVAGIPYSIYIAAALVFVTWWLLKYTKFGRSVYAIGGNHEAAVRAGIKVKKTLLGVYAFTGLMCGFAGFLNASRLGNVQPSGSVGLEMTVVAAVILGGTSILGGVGNPIGTVIGVLLMTIFVNLLVLLHVPTYWQRFFEGALMITFIVLNVAQNSFANRKKVRIDIEDRIQPLEARQ